MKINWDALNQAARASAAERSADTAAQEAVAVVLTAFEALADRLDVRARDPFGDALHGAVCRSLAEDIRTTMAEIRKVTRP